MAWLQLEIRLGQGDPLTLEMLLEELGAIAISLRDAGNEPLLEPAPGETPLWSSTLVTALFPADMLPATLSAALSGLIDANQLHYSHLSDTNWQDKWQQQLKPRQFGERLWVLPHGQAALPAHGTVVRLEPGLAFGTGEHPTTAMCLEWLDASIATGDTVLDYGCGSGLLGIAALALGAASVCATDIDDQALEATLSNAKNNACADRLSALRPELIDNCDQFDVLVANILSGTLISLGPALRPLMRPGARLAISGILAEQAHEVAAAWADWAAMQTTKRYGKWVLLSGTRRADADKAENKH